MKLREYFDQDRIAERLVAASMRQHAADCAAREFVQSAMACEAAGVDCHAEVLACWVPGRIEVLGKHTDYCGGSSLLAAAERGFAMIGARRSDRTIRVLDARRPEFIEFEFAESIHSRAGHWSNYVRTVARRVARNFPSATSGATIAFASNLPQSAGMSSSSALVVGTFMLLASINGLDRDESFRSCIDGREKLAGYLGTVENGSSYGPFPGDAGVGTFGGSEDHTAILCGQSGKLVQYAFCPVRIERTIALTDRYVFAVASSGVIAEKTGNARDQYNRLSLLAKGIVEQWQGRTMGSEASIAAILASAEDASERLRRVLREATDSPSTGQPLLNRLEHFEIENELVKSIPAMLDSSNIAEFGRLVSRSQDAAARLLANQTLETIHLVESASRLGARAASAFGAGFGGSVWALIDAADESAFLADWLEEYSKRFAHRMPYATVFASRPGPPAQLWGDDDVPTR